MQRCVGHLWEPVEIVVAGGGMALVSVCSRCGTQGVDGSDSTARPPLDFEGHFGGAVGTHESRHPSV